MLSDRFFVALGLVFVTACTAPDSYLVAECDPNTLHPTPGCMLDGGADADAGVDASSDAEPDGPTAELRECPGGWCVPAPSSDGYYWSSTFSVRFGTPDDLKDARCPGSPPQDKDNPDAVPNEEFRLFAELDAPPAACGTCTCNPSTGVCAELPAGLPSSITIDNAVCDQAGSISLPFDGPAGWGGSCTSANALPAGEKCPAGSSTPCAQSVRISPLPGPTGESCSPTSETPSFTVQAPAWKLAALACSADRPGTGCGPSRFCVGDPGPDWVHCIAGDGDQKCPDNYRWAKYVMYPEHAIVDGRGCETCACGSPEGSGCIAEMRLFDDAACPSEFLNVPVASYGDRCENIFPPGRALGAKTITDMSYVAGSCGATGGAPTGEATADAMWAVTVCCMEPFWLIE